MNKLNVLQNLKQVIEDPYPHIIIENALPDDVHQELLDTIPEQRIDKQTPRDHHNKLTWHVGEIRNEKWPVSNIWKEFIEYHCSEQFFFSVLNAFDKWSTGMPIQRDELRLLDRSQQENGSGNVYTDFSMVKHPPENNISNRTPHNDNEKEIYAGLLYLKHREDHSTGGGFAIHKAGNLAMNRQRVFDEPGPIVNVCPYKSNQFVMFWNTKKSQHSVEPRHNAVHPRWSFNIIGRFMGERMWR
jgi:hypothetical protein